MLCVRNVVERFRVCGILVLPGWRFLVFSGKPAPVFSKSHFLYSCSAFRFHFHFNPDILVLGALMSWLQLLAGFHVHISLRLLSIIVVVSISQ